MKFSILFPLAMGTIATVVRGQVTSIICPTVDNPVQFRDTDIDIANSDNLCTLNLLVNNGETLIPVARSYDSHDWEISAGPFAGLLDTACDGSSCFLSLPPLGTDETYVLTSYDYSTSQEAEVARFLEQTTYGPTKEAIEDWDYGSFPGSFKAWIEEQMDPSMVAVTSHREYFRKRSNPRLTFPYIGANLGPKPCETNSRWRNFAITVKDRDLSFVVLSMNVDGVSAPFVILVDGYPRTIVNTIAFKDASIPLNVETTYEICYSNNYYFQESFYARLFIRLGASGTCHELLDGNPLVDIGDDESLANHIIDLPPLGSSDFPSIDDDTYESEYWDTFQSNDEFLLVGTSSLDSVQCNALEQGIYENIALSYPLPPIFGRTQDDLGNVVYLLYDPRLVLHENTLENPIPDGGGQVTIDTDGAVLCSNAPRTPFNEGHCVLSTEASACSATAPPRFSITLTKPIIRGLYEETGQFVYVVENLAFNETVDLTLTRYLQRPCEDRRDRVSRWERTEDMTKCEGNYRIVGENTERLFARLLIDDEQDPLNPLPPLKDVERHQGSFCDLGDVNKYYLGYVRSESAGGDATCWHSVHPKHNDVYDLTNWAEIHRGGAPNIQKWATERGLPTLTFPTSHHPNGNERFYENIVENPSLHPRLGKLGDSITFVDLPLTLQTQGVENRFGSVDVNVARRGVVVCGTDGEVANDPSLGSGFDFDKDDALRDDTTRFMNRQRNTIWAMIVLTANDQLRQRVAFALSQILVVTPNLISDLSTTESTVDYYDIFVRNAFGNYRDILRAVSYSQRMGEMLSFRNNRAQQYYVDRNDAVAFPDENYAREIMQLFSIGLKKLKMDGTPDLDADGNEVQTYSDTDIISFARAWTGFASQNLRGNVEARSTRFDPMFLLLEWRDLFPKSDLYGGFIGDGAPLCVDLPEKHFLKKGATYRLLGGRVNPELQQDRSQWENDPDLIRLKLNGGSSPLYDKLCDPDADDVCRFRGKVVLDENIACIEGDAECEIDTIRTVQVQSLPYPIYYEYVRRPCVEEAFFNNAKRVKDWSSNRYVVQNSMCADPRRAVAAETCCNEGWETSDSEADHGFRFCTYHAERMTYETAEQRCLANGKHQCDDLRIKEHQAGICSKDQDRRLYYSWSTASCSIKVKVRNDGDIAIVHEPPPDRGGFQNVPKLVSVETNNFFKTPWNSPSYPTVDDECGGVSSSCTVYEDSCICYTTVEETAVFTTASDANRDSILSSLHVGAFSPDVYDDGFYTVLDCSVPDVQIYVQDGDSSSCSSLSQEVVFSVTDDNGIVQYLKNMESIVDIDSTYTFRNPVHFLSLVDPEVRDAYHETEAVLDHYFYHPNHPPFLASRMIQRFGISNPSPRYVKTVAMAYKSGQYEDIGSGDYGDLKAMMAAILLDREARSVSLDPDPTHGSLKEPLIKVTSAMRALGYDHDSPLMWPLLSDLERKIGQCVYEAPSVFSFFLPEFIPSGPLGTASLYSPEAQVLTGDKVTNILTGSYALVDYGLESCRGLLAERRPAGTSCGSGAGDYSRNLGKLTYSSTASTVDELLGDLSMRLTASRLSQNNTDIIKNAIQSEFESPDSGDRENAIRRAQKYVMSSPEFHSTNLVTKAETLRTTSQGPPPASEEPYKAVVFLMQAGGADSWNMLVPKGDCPKPNPNDIANLYDEYKMVRGDHAKPLEELLDLDASTSDQWCNLFGLNSELDFVKTLYDKGEATFFANTGVLQKPVSKADWQSTQSPLFSHNSQQEEAMRMDLEDEAGTTGLLGRITDKCRALGLASAVAGVDNACKACTRNPSADSRVTSLTSSTPRRFASDDVISQLNEATAVDSGMMAETWSSKLFQSIAENEEIISILNDERFSVSGFGSSGLDQDFRVLAQWIKAREIRGVKREAFFIQHGGYDDHDTSDGSNLEEQLKQVNNALASFATEMVNQTIWEGITIVTVSDFARTLVNNGNGIAGRRGTDHGWGGHYMMLGGSVKGGQILGTYPNDISDNGPLNIGRGRGRMIPDTPWEAVWNGITQWMGITDEADIDMVLPNRDNFPLCSLYTDGQLFKNGVVPPYCGTEEPTTSSSPSVEPSEAPSISPSMSPSVSAVPTDETFEPTTSSSPTVVPSEAPSVSPSLSPSAAPSVAPSMSPSAAPSVAPSTSPSTSPSMPPTDEGNGNGGGNGNGNGGGNGNGNGNGGGNGGGNGSGGGNGNGNGGGNGGGNGNGNGDENGNAGGNGNGNAYGIYNDSDGDGIPNRGDDCPGTSEGDKVDDNGCSVFQLVDPVCSFPQPKYWFNALDGRTAWFVDEGLMNPSERQATLQKARMLRDTTMCP